MVVPDTENPIAQNIRVKLESLFENFGRIMSANLIHRYQKGQGKVQHRDDSGDMDIRYGIVIYLNDDYWGGEIIYPDYNLSIKPKARSLILHPGYLNHFVDPVQSESSRYVITTFVCQTNSQEVVIKKNLGMELGKIYN
jgi:predicted 2-oxoglutarate/Fe(II)-dependent dioxygenase YbiX